MSEDERDPIVDRLEKYADLMQIGLQAAYERINDAMFVIDKGIIVYCNPAATWLFGYAIQEMLGQPIEMLVPQDKRSAHVQYRDGFVESPMPRQMAERREIPGQHKTGKVLMLRVALSYIDTARGIFPVAQVRLAERKDT